MEGEQAEKLIKVLEKIATQLRDIEHTLQSIQASMK
jgi:hypothetical protein